MRLPDFLSCESSGVDRPRRLAALRLFIVMTAALIGEVRAQDAVSAQRAPRGSYPRVNLAIGYDADARWPVDRHHAWGAMAGIALDAAGQVWLFNRGDVPVQVYTAAGKLVRSWGRGQFREPHQVRIDGEGNIWLADSGLHVVRKYAPDGKLLMTLGTLDEAGDDSAHFNRPTDVAVTRLGEIFVADGYGNNRIVHFDREGRFVKSWGELGSRRGMFSLPHSIAADSIGRLYVADRNNARIQVFDQAGRCLDEWRDLLVPWHIVVTEGDEIYACGSSPMRWSVLPIPGLLVGIPPKDQLVMVFAPDGRVKRLWSFPKGQKPGELDWVHAVAVDRQGNLYLGDIQGKRAQRFLRAEAIDREGVFASEQRPKRDDSIQRAGER
jgi:sugar lactone lactonase YvrE